MSPPTRAATKWSDIVLWWNKRIGWPWRTNSNAIWRFVGQLYGQSGAALCPVYTPAGEVEALYFSGLRNPRVRRVSPMKIRSCPYAARRSFGSMESGLVQKFPDKS